MLTGLNRILKSFFRIVESKHFLLICLIIAALIRIGWVVLVDAQPFSDFGWYYDHGVALAQSKEYITNGVPTAYWPVGYPAFLGILFSIFGPSVICAKLANIFFYLLIMYMSYILSKRLFRSEIVARVTLFVLALYPNHLAYSSLLSAEILFLFLMLSGLFLLIILKPRILTISLAGIIFGFATLTKPQALFIPGIYFAVDYFENRQKVSIATSVRRILIVYFSLSLTLAPWAIRNYKAFHGLVLVSTNGGINLLIGNNPYANGTFRWNDEIKTYFGNTEDEYINNGKARKSALSFIAHNPLKILGLLPRKLFYLYYYDFEGIQWNEAGLNGTNQVYRLGLRFLRIVAQLAYLLIWAFYLLCALRSLWWSDKSRVKNLPMIGFMIQLYFTVVYLVYFGSPRFHFPLIPFMVMYSAAFITSFYEPSPTSTFSRTSKGNIS
ncbi:MAG: glycosyltransferase family 39 protein [bacterium]|nr:glycosyltransferase family 39 protein [bacterium]